MNEIKTDSISSRYRAIGSLIVALGVPANASVLIGDDFLDNDLSTNSGIGDGFSTVFNTQDWIETGGVARFSRSDTNSGSRSQLRSSEIFAADSASETVRVSWVISDWSRNASTAGAGRLALGITDSADQATTPSNPMFTNRDGFYISMMSDLDPATGAGVASLVYIDGTTKTVVGAPWQWDDNGLDAAGGSLLDFESVGSNRDDRNAITMNASSMTLSLELGLDSWAITFSGPDGVILPADQSGTFSGLGLMNDLSSAIVNSHAQGSHEFLFDIDKITLEIGDPTPPSVLAITEIEYSSNGEPNPTVTLTWSKTGAASYKVARSEDLINWGLFLDENVEEERDENTDDSGNMTVTFDLTNGLESLPKLFFRIEEGAS